MGALTTRLGCYFISHDLRVVLVVDSRVCSVRGICPVANSSAEDLTVYVALILMVHLNIRCPADASRGLVQLFTFLSEATLLLLLNLSENLLLVGWLAVKVRYSKLLWV